MGSGPNGLARVDLKTGQVEFLDESGGVNRTKDRQFENHCAISQKTPVVLATAGVSEEGKLA
jgi:hypothetical protein